MVFIVWNFIVSISSLQQGFMLKDKKNFLNVKTHILALFVSSIDLDANYQLETLKRRPPPINKKIEIFTKRFKYL